MSMSAFEALLVPAEQCNCVCVCVCWQLNALRRAKGRPGIRLPPFAMATVLLILEKHSSKQAEHNYGNTSSFLCSCNVCCFMRRKLFPKLLCPYFLGTKISLIMNNDDNLPGTTPRTSEQTGHSSGASGSSSESESSSESDSDSESSSSDSECNRASRAATPEPEPPSTNKWQLDKWLNKVNPHNKALINTQSDSHGLNSSQPDESQASENQSSSKSKPSTALAPADPKERTLLSPIREKAKPKTGQKAPDSKSTKVKSPASIELAPPRRSTGKKQPKKVERSSSSEEHNWPRPGNSSSTPKEKEPPPLEPPKPRGKGPGVKTAPRKEPRTTTTNTAPTNITPVPDKKKHRGPNKIIPKSKEFIETESSSSECHSDPEELTKVQLPCPGPNTLSLKSKDCNSNILSVSSLTSTSSTSIPDPGASDLLEEPLFSPIPIVQNELLSPLRDFEDIKSLWVKIELSFLSRIPGQDPPEPPPTKAECRESEHCDVMSGGKKLRMDKDALLLPPCISPIHNHKVSSTKDSLKKQPRKREDKLLPPLLSPLSDEPVGRPRRSSECSSISQEGNTSTVPNSLPSTRTIPASTSSSSSSSHKHRKGDNKSFSHSKTSTEEDSHSKPSGGFHGNGQSDTDLWSNPSGLSMEHMEPRRPKLTFNNTVHNADYYMQEAKKLKHKADALMDKFGKAVNYADGALSFIECGNAMERDPLEAKSPYTMYSETVELISHFKCRLDKPFPTKEVRYALGPSKGIRGGISTPPPFPAYHQKLNPALCTSSQLNLLSAIARRQSSRIMKDFHMVTAETYSRPDKSRPCSACLSHHGGLFILNVKEGQTPCLDIDGTSVVWMREKCEKASFGFMGLCICPKHLVSRKHTVESNRCLSLLYLRMFKLKKDHAMKYSRSLMEYFKNSAKSSQAPSPWGANGKSTGTPSPMSLSPSPVSSVSSGAGVMGSSSASGSVAIPQRIHHMAASHVNITNNILRSYEHWETADKLAQESQVLSGAGLSNGTVDAAQQHDRTGALHTPRIALASAGGPFVIVLALPLCSSFLSVFRSLTLFPAVHHYLHHLCHLQPSGTLREVGS
ncbi:AF4/FMR2 family member 2 [Labeo rohita]|uniref:AF4/FMR2 family member 2 n=1 Tax=Labeo rohita TaxID=84645 RepID=A0ABQ8M2S5_LABRO|nr:AF4/FMR2 family member 2 [Labeo rohita]